MADRFLFKKFASETNDVGQFGSFQATGGNIGDGVKTTDPDLIQSLPAWKAGWGNAVDNGLLLPRLEEMNGVQRVFAEMLWNQWRDGITFWQAGAPVKALQSVVMYQTGDEKPKLYINKTGVNGTNPPPQDTDNWDSFFNIEDFQVNNVYSYGMSQYYKGTMNNASWLKSAGQWNSGTVYTGMYQWLVEQMNAGVSGFVASTDTYTDYDFVINTVDQTFRLPLKNGQEGIFADGVKGNGISIGLSCKDGTNLALGGQSVAKDNGYSYYLATQLAKYGSPVGTAMGNFATQAANTTFGLTTDPSKSGMIVDKTVPSGWNLYYYVGDTVQDASLINAGAVLGQLSDKISRTAASDRELVVGWGMPDYTSGVQLTGSTYTATYKCWLIGITNVAGQTEQSVLINGSVVGKEYTDYCNIQIPLDAGDVVTVSAGTFAGLKVYAMKGIGNA